MSLLTMSVARREVNWSQFFCQIKETVESVLGEKVLKEPVRCCMYMLLPTKMLQSLYLSKETEEMSFSFVPLYLARSLPM